MGSESKSGSNKGLMIALIAVIALLLVVVVLVVVLFTRPAAEQPGETGSQGTAQDTPKIGYAEGVTVVDDPDALQKAVDEMLAEAAKGGMTLEYKGEASSTDGKNFECYIANAVDNKYDMYIQMFADAELTDQLLLTGLIRPGSAFDNITLEHSLDRGTHTVYVVFTQVEEDLATIHAQVVVTMSFTVE